MLATGALLLTKGLGEKYLQIASLTRSLMKRTEKKELAFSGTMISGEEPPYRPLSKEKIDIEKGAYRS